MTPEHDDDAAAGTTEDPLPEAGDAADKGDGTGDRRAVLGSLARWAALAPAMAVLVDPDSAEAAPSFGGGD